MSWPSIQVDRRSFLYRAGVAAGMLTAAGSLLARASDARAAGVRGLVGATIGTANFPAGTTETQASEDFDGYVGRPMAATVQKIYYQEGSWPSTIPTKDREVIDLGAKLLISFKPSRTLSMSEQQNLANAIDMYKTAGATLDVTLWQEPNDGGAFSHGSDYASYVDYYGPTVRAAGVPLVYDAGAGGGESSWTAYYPGGSMIDKIMLDYYGSAWLGGTRLDVIANIADSANPPKPLGLGEWNDTATSSVALTSKQFGEYVNYLINFFTARLNDGKTNGDIIFWMGNNAVGLSADQILSGSDFKVRLVQKLYDSLS
jgi:hypothetical protein